MSANLFTAQGGPSIEVCQTEAIALLRSVAPKSAQLIFADPPYGIAYYSNHYVGANPHAPIARDWNFQIGPFLNEAGAALTDGGALYLCTRWDVALLWTQWIAPPLTLTNSIIWLKDNHSAGDLTGNFGYQYEILLFITKGRHRLRGKRHSNVWPFPRIASKKLRHPAEKPVGLVRRAIEASSDPGQLVVDPFCGSGTTGAAGEGRRVLLGDIDPAMSRMTCERLGLPVPDSTTTLPAPLPVCPVFNIVPPLPVLWGVHPEDVAHWREREMP